MFSLSCLFAHNDLIALLAVQVENISLAVLRSSALNKKLLSSADNFGVGQGRDGVHHLVQYLIHNSLFIGETCDAQRGLLPQIVAVELGQ